MVIRLLSIIHSGIILDFVCRFGGSVGEDVRADFPFRRAENLCLISQQRRCEKW